MGVLLWKAPVLALSCLSLAGAGAQDGEAESETCAAGERCGSTGTGAANSTEDYYWWPTTAGRVGQYSLAPYEQPWDLAASLAWSADYPLNEDPHSHSITLGTTIDHEFNVYVSAHDGIMKHNGSDGTLLWKYKPQGITFPFNPCLYKGLVYGCSHQGDYFALNMHSGQEVWRRKVAYKICADTATITVHDDIIVGSIDPVAGTENFCERVIGVNASDGSVLWHFRTDTPVWNIMAQYPEDGTTVFQDHAGKVYRLRLDTGDLLWKNGGWSESWSWSDGTQLLYGDVVYGVQNNGCLEVKCTGRLTAYRLSDGSKLWSVETPRPANVFPAVGPLRKGAAASVVLPLGMQPHCTPGFQKVPYWHLLPLSVLGLVHKLSIWLGDYSRFLWRNEPTPADVYAYDAATGALQWVWKGPVWNRLMCPGDEEDWPARVMAGTRSACCPNPWGGPRISEDGTVYLGGHNGEFFALRDINGDGRIDDSTEVKRFQGRAAFSGTGSAHAPGMIAVASCDHVYVFRK